MLCHPLVALLPSLYNTVEFLSNHVSAGLWCQVPEASRIDIALDVKGPPSVAVANQISSLRGLTLYCDWIVARESLKDLTNPADPMVEGGEGKFAESSAIFNINNMACYCSIILYGIFLNINANNLFTFIFKD